MFRNHGSALDFFRIRLGWKLEALFFSSGHGDGCSRGVVFKAIIQGLRPAKGVHQPALCLVLFVMSCDKKNNVLESWFSFAFL